MRMEIGGKVFEKDWAVPEEHAKHIISAANMVNTTIDNMSVKAANMKRITTEAVVKVKNFSLKKK